MSDEKSMKLSREIQELERENQSLRCVYTYLERFIILSIMSLRFYFAVNRNEVKTAKHQIQRRCEQTEILEKKIEKTVSIYDHNHS